MRAILLMLALASTLAAQAQAAGVALITDLSGRVEAEEGAAAPAILAELGEGVRLRLAPGARATLLYLASGDEYRLKGAGRYRIGAAAPAVLQGAQPEKSRLPADALPGVRVKPSSVTQATLIMRGLARPLQPRLLEPVSTKVLSDRPDFRWEGVPGAAKYRLQVVDDGGRIAAEWDSAETKTQLPESVRLREGAAYTWSVEAQLADGRKSGGKSEFAVLESDLRAKLERLRPGTEAKFSERVVYALLLEQYELRDAAREEWRKLAAERKNETLLKERAGE